MLDRMQLVIRAVMLITMLVSIVLLNLGIRSLVDGVPTEFFHWKKQSDTGSWTGKESMKRDAMIINLAYGIIGFCVALVLSAYRHSEGPPLRAGERARVRDYCAELFKRGRVSEAFWSIIGLVVASLCVVDLLITSMLIGHAAFDVGGLRAFKADEDTDRYWWYVVLNILPLISC